LEIPCPGGPRREGLKNILEDEVTKKKRGGRGKNSLLGELEKETLTQTGCGRK